MLKKEDIKDGQFVRYRDTMISEKYYVIKYVGNAIEKGDRDTNYDKDELSYSIINLLTGEEQDGICEHSGMSTHFLSPTTKKDVELYLKGLEANFTIELGKIKEKLNEVYKALEKLKNG